VKYDTFSEVPPYHCRGGRGEAWRGDPRGRPRGSPTVSKYIATEERRGAGTLVVALAVRHHCKGGRGEVWRGDPPPFVLPECGALAAQQRWQDG
jgi:hypothetical protein